MIKTDTLTGVAETLLIPVGARAREHRRPDALFHDPWAARIVENLDDTLERFAKDWLSQAGIAVRTEILDQAVHAFLARHPDALVVNLGAGLCTRFFRLDNGHVRWVELDLPEAIALRREIFEENRRCRLLAHSVLDHDWMERVEETPRRPILFVAEGLLYYFTEDQVRAILTALARRFPGSELLFESVSPLMVRLSSRHPSVGKTSARFHWGIRTGKSLAGWDKNIHFVEEWSYFDRHPERWRWLRLLRRTPPLRDLIKIVHLRFAP